MMTEIGEMTPLLVAAAQVTTTGAPATRSAIAGGTANAGATPGAVTGPPSVAGGAIGPETEAGVVEIVTATAIIETVAVSRTVAARSLEAVLLRTGPLTIRQAAREVSGGSLVGVQTGASGPHARSVPGTAPTTMRRSPRRTRLQYLARVPARSRPLRPLRCLRRQASRNS